LYGLQAVAAVAVDVLDSSHANLNAKRDRHVRWIRPSTDGSILEVTIRPPQGQRHRPGDQPRLNEVFIKFRDDKALRIAIITGAGEKFSPPAGI